MLLGLTLYSALVVPADVADHGTHAPGVAQPFDLAESGDDVHDVFGIAGPAVLDAARPDTASSLPGLIFFAVATSAGFFSRPLRGPPAEG